MRLLASGFVCVATSVSFERHVEGVSRWLTSIVQTNGDVSTIDGGVKDGLQLESRVQDLPTNPVLRVEKQSGRPLNSSKQAAESRVTEPFTQASPPSAESTSDAATVISNNPSHSPGKPIGFMEREPDARLGEENKGINNALRATVMDRDVVDARHEESSDANGEVVRAPVRQVVKSEVGTQPIVGDQRPVAQGNFSPDTAPRVVKKTETIARKKVYAPVVGADGSVITPASDNEEVKKTETTIEVPHPTAKSTQPTSAVVLSAFVAKHVPIDATSGATQKYIAAVPTTFGVHSAKVDGEVTPVHDAHEAADMGAAMRTVAFGVDKGGASRMVRTKFKHADSEYWRTFSGRAEEYSKQYIAATQDRALPRGVVAVADGTGLGGNPYRKTPVDYLMEEQLRFHVRIQDLSLLVLFLLAYFCVIAYGFVIVYRSSRFLTSAKYFDDKFVHHCRNSERDNFLDCFNRPLQKVQLHIIGYRPGFSGGFMHTLWRRRQYQVAFHTALDIGEYVTDTLGDITADDMLTMDEFLQERSETLNTLVIKKCTNWDQWEQLAVNIKSAICRAGFEGVVDVNFQASEDVVVHQNNQWSNFLKHHTTKTLFFLSIFGVLWYYPYLAFKKKKYVIESHFKVEKSSAEFWDIVRSALCKDGFDPRIRFN